MDHLPVGDVSTGQPDFEEYEEVESVIDCKGEEDYSQHNCQDEDVPKCRFCWSSNASYENPLFCSCKCSGSVGYIHF